MSAPTKPVPPLPPGPLPDQPEQRRGQRLLFVAVLFGVLLTFPFLGTFDRETRIGGVPGLYLYVLLIWAALVALTGWLVRGKSGKN
ncbi:hypothetical protein [Hymenobacter canadensis]|uniref:DUF3311 domain-containing protein n=1 Tax=Hymenobacter canadensis TaxID=2999067 RepID=A0ABY7LUA0_9BACT|nr:hypothetical protein [Hymenobacter canadensis]WBA42805.1 hypothetical protein O3303_04405 [Hymenobacter canadensis]